MVNNHQSLTHDRLVGQTEEFGHPYDTQRRLEVLIDEFLGAKDLRNVLVLDGGCGAGQGTERLIERGARVIGLDYGPNLARVTQERYGAPTLVGSVLRLPFADGQFEIVYSSEVIEHTPDPLQAAHEFYRVLAPGGELVLSTPNWVWQIPVRVASTLGMRPYDGLENFVWSRRLREALEAKGATILAHRGIHLLPFQIPKITPLLRQLDTFGTAFLPLMVNQAIHCQKPTT